MSQHNSNFHIIELNAERKFQHSGYNVFDIDQPSKQDICRTTGM
jgi:hypothetical protein